MSSYSIRASGVYGGCNPLGELCLSRSFRASSPTLLVRSWPRSIAPAPLERTSGPGPLGACQQAGAPRQVPRGCRVRLNGIMLPGEVQSPTFPVSAQEGEGFRLEPTGGCSWPVPNSGLNKVIWGPGKLAPSDLGFLSTEFWGKSTKFWLCLILLFAVLLGFYR